jgi:hypothetical protein
MYPTETNGDYAMEAHTIMFSPSKKCNTLLEYGNSDYYDTRCSGFYPAHLRRCLRLRLSAAAHEVKGEVARGGRNGYGLCGAYP